MNWNHITGLVEIDNIIQKSHTTPQVIFKHSTRCSISSIAKSRLERDAFPSHVDFYYLDLIKYRSISNAIEKIFDVQHESPQVLIIRNGKCVYDESHNGIRMDEILAMTKQ